MADEALENLAPATDESAKVAPSKSVDSVIVIPIVNAIFVVLIKLTAKLPKINAGLIGLDALLDVWLPDFIATITPDKMTVKGITLALLTFLQSMTVGEPVLHGILVAATWALNYFIPQVKAQLKLKGVNPGVPD